ncbi:hypothetical protein OIV68_33475, partial [Burkholderia pseudomallei]|nr:hypothetical protein [Burkholderia pseudomallei]
MADEGTGRLRMKRREGETRRRLRVEGGRGEKRVQEKKNGKERRGEVKRERKREKVEEVKSGREKENADKWKRMSGGKKEKRRPGRRGARAGARAEQIDGGGERGEGRQGRQDLDKRKIEVKGVLMKNRCARPESEPANRIERVV